MTQSFYPLANSPILNDSQWSKMARNWLSTGVIKGELNELLSYADSTGMQIKVKSGQAFIKGHFFESDVEEVLAIGSANAIIPRIDRVIVRLDWVANTIQLAVLQGVPAASPVAPALTQNTSRWEISLAQVRVNASVSTIASGNVTDERYFVKNSNSPAPYFEGNKSDAANIQPSTWTKILNPGIVTNRAGGTWGSGGDYTVPSDGVYVCTLSFYLELLAAGKQLHAAVYKNGVLGNENRLDQRFTGGAGDGIMVGATLVDCKEEDVLSFYIYHNDTVTRNLSYAHMKVAKLP